eukprot:TRINITY_DN1815_c0_g1_i1.p1 TRINITY_DN1815_c0_g1~~TRINITY_DN1815_c0_g1_i1.p1  ORF type:complete len:143 (+),score=25.99 TRINITY_DN1815_c0_g1_i1:126-554(+)
MTPRTPRSLAQAKTLRSPHNTFAHTPSFWSTTGLYPQEIFLGFKDEVRVTEIRTVTENVGKLSLERVIPNASEISQVLWKRILTVDVPSQEGQLQTEIHKVNNIAIKYLKLVIHEGANHGPISAVFSVNLKVNDSWIFPESS